MDPVIPRTAQEWSDEIPFMSMMASDVVEVTRTTGTTLEHQIVGWLTVIGSLLLYN